MQRLLASLILLLAFLTSGFSVGAQGTSTTADLAGVLEAARTEAEIPGLVGAVFSCDAVLESAAVGLRRADGTAEVTLDDPFHIGSNAKAMTATMIAALVEAGTLTWATRPEEVLPELVGLVNPAFADVTLEHLLAHRSGLPGWEDLEDIPELVGSGTEQRRAAAALLLGGEPSGPVGEFLYSNAGYAVAAAMAEEATGQTWEALMNVELFEPLGITANVGWPDGPDAVWGHARIDGPLVPVDPQGEYQVLAGIAPAGDLNMTLPDYVTFAQLHLCGLGGQPRLLSAPTFAKLHASAGPMGDGGQGYALGWGIVDLDGVTASGHGGSAGTFHAMIFLVPEQDLGVIVLANVGEAEGGEAVPNAALAALALYQPA